MLLDLHEALAPAAPDEQLVGCNFALEARGISDGGGATGRSGVTSRVIAVRTDFGSSTITSSELNPPLIRELYTIFIPDFGGLGICDGVTTYAIENGQIQLITDHGRVTLVGPGDARRNCQVTRDAGCLPQGSRALDTP